MNSAVLGIGLVVFLIGGLSLVGYIPNLTPQSTTPLCVQSVVAMATVCSSALSTTVDSITYQGTVIAPVFGNQPVGIPQSESQGTLIGYYFLASGATLRSSSVSWCSGLNCSPSQSLSATSSPSPSVTGLYLLTAQSPSMSVGNYYTYQFSITDSSGTSSTNSGTVVLVAATPTWTASVQTFSGIYNIGSSSGGTVTSAINVYNNDAPRLSVTITNNAAVTGVSISVSPSGQTIALTHIAGSTNLWQAQTSFAVGEYTLTGTIASGSQQVTAFSIRLTSAPAPTISTSLSFSSTFSTSFTITDSNCYTNTPSFSDSTTFQGTTCSHITENCGPTGCTGTTTYSSGTGTTSGGSSTSGSSTTSSTTTTTSTSTTPICQNAVNCPPNHTNWVAIMLLIGGAAMMAFGFVRKDDD